MRSLGGVATRNDIMLVSHIRHLQDHEGVTHFTTAVVRGATERLVPILMTALAAGLALVPIALSAGEPGTEIQAPMPIVNRVWPVQFGGAQHGGRAGPVRTPRPARVPVIVVAHDPLIGSRDPERCNAADKGGLALRDDQLVFHAERPRHVAGPQAGQRFVGLVVHLAQEPGSVTVPFSYRKARKSNTP
jgi:AcrB/AcrD/AcrF family